MRSPEGDAVVERVARIGCAMVGDEDQQGVARAQPRSQLAERPAQFGPGGRPQAVAGKGGILEVRGVAQEITHRRAFEQPGSLRLGPAHRQVGRRVAAVAGQDGHVIARHLGARNQVGELAQMRQMRGKVVLPIAAPADHQDVQMFGRHRLGRAQGCGGEQQQRKEESSQHEGLARPTPPPIAPPGASNARPLRRCPRRCARPCASRSAPPVSCRA